MALPASCGSYSHDPQSNDAKPQVLFERVEVPVVVQEGEMADDAAGRNDGVHRLAHRHAFRSQWPEVPCGLDGNVTAAKLHLIKRAQQPPSSLKAWSLANPCGNMVWGIGLVLSDRLAVGASQVAAATFTDSPVPLFSQVPVLEVPLAVAGCRYRRQQPTHWRRTAGPDGGRIQARSGPNGIPDTGCCTQPFRWPRSVSCRAMPTSRI